MVDPDDVSAVTVTVNGILHHRLVESRLLLSDFIRNELGLTGTRIGCEQGVCGACTVQVNGAAVRSCLTFAVQVDGGAIRTVEALSPDAATGALHPVQQAFARHHALQCGFCTAGFLMTIDAALADGSTVTADDLLSGNLCRCTGYQGIRAAAEELLARPERGT